MTTRRQFLSTFGAGATGACFAAALTNLGGARAAFGGLCGPGEGRLDFGALEPMVSEIQTLEPSRLLEALAARLASGTPLDELVAASALANTRTFGGADYDGYHAFMAHMPAWKMAQRLTKADAALPVLKVIYRSASRIRDFGGVKAERLAAPLAGRDGTASEQRLLERVRATDSKGAEEEFASFTAAGIDAAFAALLPLVRDEMDVHRIVLAWRVRESLGALDTAGVVAPEHAATLFRQVLHFCIDREPGVVKKGRTAVRTEVPEILAKHGLDSSPLGSRRLDDAELTRLADAVFCAPRLAATEAVAAALASGVAPDDVGEALTIAANRLLLADNGTRDPADGKPRGSVHGASLGVHASDSATAWRNIARVTPAAAASMLVAGAYHTAGQSTYAGDPPFSWTNESAAIATGKFGPKDLLERLDGAVKGNDQRTACATAEHYLAAGHDAEALIAKLLGASIEADGALHAEKYFATATEEHARARPAFRDRHLVALARVCASQSVKRAPGIDQARALLGYV